MPKQPDDRPPTLTIGQLADYVGVTIRAIRHYHQRGLLAGRRATPRTTVVTTPRT